MSVSIKQISADELLHMPDDGFCYELIEGELIKMSPPGSEHGVITMNISVLLAQHVKARKLGVVFGAETGFQISSHPDTVLAPDVAFVRRARVPAEGVPKGYWPGPPDLAVEVLSPDDTLKAAKEKSERWLESGTLMVWTVNPRRQSVIVHRSGFPPITIAESATLDGEDVVHGFTCRVGELFA